MEFSPPNSTINDSKYLDYLDIRTDPVSQNKGKKKYGSFAYIYYSKKFKIGLQRFLTIQF